MTTTAVLVAFVADLLLSRRIADGGPAAGALTGRSCHRGRAGLIRYPGGQRPEGRGQTSSSSSAMRTTAICRRRPNWMFRSSSATPPCANPGGGAIDERRAVAVVTRDDMVNIETGIVSRELLGPRCYRTDWPDVPVVLRVYDRACAAVAHRFGFGYVRSTVELAAPWFIGAAMGLQVIGTFSVGQRSFMVGGVHVEPGSELDGWGWSICPHRPGLSRSQRPRRTQLIRCRDTLLPPAIPPIWLGPTGTAGHAAQRPACRAAGSPSSEDRLKPPPWDPRPPQPTVGGVLGGPQHRAAVVGDQFQRLLALLLPRAR